ncbi:pol [Symbiodinium sp. CCMP2592]|nr:pol [Symbiodinium sp. CCMP2592]
MEGDVVDVGAGVGTVDCGSQRGENRRLRKRDRGRAVKDEEDEEEKHQEESPSKRANADGDAPLSARELRYLLQQHMCEFRQAWSGITGRLDRVEHAAEQLPTFQGRLQVVEKDNVVQQQQLHVHEEKIKGLENDLETIKQTINDNKRDQASGSNQGQPLQEQRGQDGWRNGNDPWARFINHQQQRGREGLDGWHGASGGWSQDTRKSVIEEEALVLLNMEGVKEFLDCEKITVFGPRKSFGVIRFLERNGENFAMLKERMWGVIKFVAALKHKWPSAGNDAKPAWASFLKTKGARLRTSHASMLRRVTMQLACETKDANGAPCHPASVLSENYDVDWNAGTVWLAAAKLGSATHRQPRGENVKLMSGRQIDAILTRSAKTDRVCIDAERRKTINTDHAALILTCHFKKRARQWGTDSRPRWVQGELDCDLLEWDDILHAAKSMTRPSASSKYQDPEHVTAALRRARKDGDKTAWKAAYKQRRLARRYWQQERRSRALAGDWTAYRAVKREKVRRTGWWGKLLAGKSDEQLTAEVQQHLHGKLYDDTVEDWNGQLQQHLDDIPCPTTWKPYTAEEVAMAIASMRAKSSVGPDLVGVDLLRKIMIDETLSQQLIDILNFHAYTLSVPEIWDVSLLALLAKIDWPEQPRDLRPIAMSSALTLLDATRLRDNTKEWRLPILMAKLDVRGAFDRVKREAAVDLLKKRTLNMNVDVETRWLIRQLGENKLQGLVPGGGAVEILCNSGIKQGAPESAELFGLLMGDVLDELLGRDEWRKIKIPWGDADVVLAFYQDDVFVWDECAGSLSRRIELIAKQLRVLGLELAEDKTMIISSRYYKGPRSIRVGDNTVEIQGEDVRIRVLGVNFAFGDPPGQQARDLLGRATSAALFHADILGEEGKWEDKSQMMDTLVAGTFTWAAGAVHWNQEELAMANAIQIRTLRKAFHLRRRPAEDWLGWHKRTWRLVRAWMHTNQIRRWSTHILQLQHGLLGHWARQVEGWDNDGNPIRGLTYRILQWRGHEWWKREQSLVTGVRHPGCFYPDCTERRVAETIGLNWGEIAQNREVWKCWRDEWVKRFDVKWTAGRQAALRW